MIRIPLLAWPTIGFLSSALYIAATGPATGPRVLIFTGLAIAVGLLVLAMIVDWETE